MVVVWWWHWLSEGGGLLVRCGLGERSFVRGAAGLPPTPVPKIIPTSTFGAEGRATPLVLAVWWWLSARTCT